MTVSKEVRDGLQTVFLPKIDQTVEGVELVNGYPIPTDDQDIAYNAHCTQMIKDALLAKREENSIRIANLETTTSMSAEDRDELIEQLRTPMIRTRYPADDDGSEDVVSLDREDEIVVLDAGTR